MKYLTKTLYVAGCRCPKLLWLQYYDKGRPIDKFSQFLFESGNNVEQVAYRLFPGGILVNAGYSSLNELCARTEKVMRAQPNYLFQGAFRCGTTLCITDVLSRKTNGWDLSEIKMSSKTKSEHIQDVAFQTYCLTKCNVNVIGKYVVHINKEYIKHREINPSELFVSENIGDRVELEMLRVPENISAFCALLQKNMYPCQPMGKQCRNPHPCPYINYCLSEAKTLPGCDIIINREPIIEFVSKIKQPVHFLDFETNQPPVPLFDGTRPYQKVPFQFSLHIFDGKLTHISFLATNRQDPRRLLAESLLTGIGPEGSLVAWNAIFEIGIIKELAHAMPDLEMDLLALIPRFVDLMMPFKKKYYCHPGFCDSYSLKNVLPVLVPALDYKNMVVSKAEDAFLAFHAYVERKIDDAGWEMAQMGLLAYCGLDTAGMVAILAILKGITR